MTVKELAHGFLKGLTSGIGGGVVGAVVGASVFGLLGTPVATTAAVACLGAVAGGFTATQAVAMLSLFNSGSAEVKTTFATGLVATAALALGSYKGVPHVLAEKQKTEAPTTTLREEFTGACKDVVVTDKIVVLPKGCQLESPKR